jgi:hypothetical protein
MADLQKKNIINLIKSNIVNTIEEKSIFNKERKTERLELYKKESIELPKIEYSSGQKLIKYYIESKQKVKIAIEIYKIKRLIDMKSPILEQLKHKPIWLKIIGVILMILAFFGINTEVVSPLIDQIAQVIVGIITLISGFMVDKKEVEPKENE